MSEGTYSEPEQTALAQPIELSAPEGYTITATDEYRVEALIVSTHRYRWGREADLSPVDFLLAWGAVTEEPNLNGIRYSQSGRWGYFRFNYGDVNLNERQIAQSTANTHIIPDFTDRDLRDSLLSLKRGDTARLSGYLVRVTADDGWKWNSSRSRTDSGGHSCELFYVTEFE